MAGPATPSIDAWSILACRFTMSSWPPSGPKKIDRARPARWCAPKEGEQLPRPTAVPPRSKPKPPARAPAVAPAAGEDRTVSLVHDRLIEAMDLRRLDLDALGSQELRDKTESTLRQSSVVT